MLLYKVQELEMDRDVVYVALSEHDLCDCIQPAKKKEWESLQSEDGTDDISAKSTTNFYPPICCAKQKKHDRREFSLFKEESAEQKFSVCLVKPVPVTTLKQTN